MTMKRILKTSQYLCSFLVVCFVPFSEVILHQDRLVLAQNTQSAPTTLYISPNQGKDSNLGTINSPLQTITQALKSAPADAVISLAPGTYSEATGEVFPLIIRDRLTLQGSLGGNGRNVIIKGGGSFNSRTGAGQNVAIAALKTTTAIKGLTIINPNDRGHGLWVESANPEISHNTFTRNGNTGLSVNGRSKPLITNNYFRNNAGNGLLIYGQSSPTVTNNVFDNTGFGVSLVQQTKAVIEDNEFLGNRIGLIFEGNSQGKLRGNTIINSWEYGLVAIANSQVDLGSSAQSGENVFRGNQKLAIQNITKNIISASGTEVRGAIEGQIDFGDNSISTVAIDSSSSTSSNLARNNQASRLRNNPLPGKGSPTWRSPRPSRLSANQQVAVNNPPRSSVNSPSAESEILPPPPVVKEPKSPESPLSPPRSIEQIPAANSSTGNFANSDNATSNTANKKEFVFTAPRNSPPLLPESNGLDSRKPTIFSAPAKTPSTTLRQRPANLPLPSLKSPSVLGRNGNRSNAVNSLSDLLGGSRPSTASFRVLVEAGQQNQQQQILSLYPSAKKTVYRGKSMYQVGVFSDRSAAEKTSRALANLRLTSYILE